MTKLRVAVSGVGSLGQHHARIAAASERTELVAVVDPSEVRGREIAEKFGTSWAASLVEVLPRVDAVQIAAPTGFHHAIGLQVLLAQTLLTALLAPMLCSLQLLFWRQVGAGWRGSSV